MVTWIDTSGGGPANGQSAALTVSAEGEVTIIFGGQVHGQGHATPFSQIVADELGIGHDRIRTSHGDTGVLPWGSITGGSRSGPVTGSAVLMAARKVRDKMAKIAAHSLGVADGTRMVFSDGRIHPEGDPGKTIEFQKVAAAAYAPRPLPQGMEPTIYEHAVYVPRGNAYPFGTHLAVVEVDRETGVIRLLKYFAVDDIGKAINPLVVDGQVHGAVVQGLGQAMLEQVIYDENGQLLTSTLADYAMPSAEMFPNFVLARTETPSPNNLLGIKGIGEGGACAATPAFVNAVEDALSPYGTTVDLMPLRPDYVKSIIDGRHSPPRRRTSGLD